MARNRRKIELCGQFVANAPSAAQASRAIEARERLASEMQPASISYPQKIQGRELNRKERPKGVLRVNASGTSATSEIANVNLDAGEAVIRVSDFNFATVPAGTPCGTLTVN